MSILDTAALFAISTRNKKLDIFRVIKHSIFTTDQHEVIWLGHRCFFNYITFGKFTALCDLQITLLLVWFCRLTQSNNIRTQVVSGLD